jgi:hypothetical protein
MKRLHLLLAITVISCVGATANAQSVADLARQERLRKKELESKAVLTNSSKPPVAPAAVVPPAAASSEAAKPAATNAPVAEAQKEPAKAAAPTGPVDNKGRDEKYWRTTFDQARQELKRAQDKVTLLDLKMNDLQGELYREGVYAHEQEIRKQIDDTQKAKAAANEEVDAAQRKISDLEDELRRSGGQPGWAR